MPKNGKYLDYLLLIVGTTLLAYAINLFYEPNGLVTGGVSGLGIIIQTVSRQALGFTVPLWATNIVLNLPLFILGARVMGARFLRRTLFATVYLTVALFFTAYLPQIKGTDLLLSAVFGGAVGGLGLGLVFRCMATTGGSDLAASILHERYKHISISKLMFAIDAVIVTLGFFTFGATKAMYAIIAIFINSKMTAALLEGLDFAKAAFIISENADRIAEKLLAELSRGATGLYG
ncbi:MAG: YitT family protein, partial [Clostridiales bacterium]|nr:YitT family protein [Clostridiales bacterium]